MPKFYLLLFAWVSVHVYSAEPAGKVKTADDDWKHIATLTPSIVTVGKVNNSAAANASAQPKLTDQQKIAQLKQTAQSAKDFYTNYPADARARAAEKIEVTCLLLAARHTDPDQGQAALQLAGTYRTKTTNPIKDRVEVASVMERQKYSLQNSGKSLSKDAVQHEKIADSLQKEFGDTSEVYAFYLGVVNTADFEAANRVAKKITQQNAPTHSKAEAKVTLDRYSTLGKVPAGTFQADDGRKVSLGEPGKPTVVFVWSPRQTPNHFAALGPYKKQIPSDMRWVYVSVNSTAGPFNLTKGQAPFPGTHLFEPAGPEGPISQILKIRRVPFIYVLDRKGALAGYGEVSELPALLKLANR